MIAINCRFRFFLRNIEYQSGSVELWNCHTAVLSQFFLFYLFTVERHGLTGSAVSIYIVFLLNCKYSLNKLVFLILLLTNDREINRQRRISPLKKLEIFYISRNPIDTSPRYRPCQHSDHNWSVDPNVKSDGKKQRIWNQEIKEFFIQNIAVDDKLHLFIRTEFQFHQARSFTFGTK